MKWFTHKVLTFAAVSFLTDSVLCAVAAACGSVLPDRLEFVLYGKNIPPWKHRRWSHWPLPYAFLSVLFWGLSGRSFPFLFAKDYPSLSFVFAFLGWTSAGAHMHILQDALCGRVPFWSPGKKTFGMRLFRVGSHTEKVLLVAGILALVLKYI